MFLFLANLSALADPPSPRHQTTGAVIARCGQPEVSWWGWRNADDEHLVQSIAKACAVDSSSRKHLSNGGYTNGSDLSDTDFGKSPGTASFNRLTDMLYTPTHRYFHTEVLLFARTADELCSLTCWSLSVATSSHKMHMDLINVCQADSNACVNMKHYYT